MQTKGRNRKIASSINLISTMIQSYYNKKKGKFQGSRHILIAIQLVASPHHETYKLNT